VLISSCVRQDNFSAVTKLIDIQDTISIGQPFEFRLILRNDSSDEMKLTIDDSVQKSLSFNLQFRCDDELIRTVVENPKSVKHNYQKYYLKNGDSLVYDMQGLFRQTKEGLQMEIEGCDMIYKMGKVSCNNLTVDFGGMWNPGDFNPLDAMEGYNFNKKISIKTSEFNADI